ncbi:LacI family transcriptional regulator [Streptomyces kurssanovii]|nr:LacI family transcriptional regulator [Streptomyces kurssanovii]
MSPANAGVSASTVSYVLSGKRSISSSTRERVERSIEELGYRPHAGARALASNRSGIIALMVPLRTDIYVPVMLQIAMAVTTTARARLRRPPAHRGGGAGGRAACRGQRGGGRDDRHGRGTRRRTAAAAEGRPEPAVLIGLPADPGGLSCVGLDFTAAGALCVEHLAGLGHREIAFIGEAPGVYERHTGFAERTLAGLRSAAGTHGMRLLHRPCASGWTAVAATLGRVLEERPGTTAFVVQNEAATDPLLALLRQQRLAVPEDVSVVAICPDQVAAQAPVSLTAVTVPAQDMGRRAVEQVVAMLDGGETAGTVLLAPELTVRASSGPVPR